MTRTRTRSQLNGDYPTYYSYSGTNAPVELAMTGFSQQFPHKMSEETVDEIHSKYPYEGGPFLSKKVTTEFVADCGKNGKDYYDSVWTRKWIKSYYEGEVMVAPPVSTPSFLSLGFSDAEAYGPSCWNLFKPAQPDVPVSVFLAELRDMPGLVFKKLDSFRSLGNNYLAYQFGWKPFLSDLRKWYKSIIKVDRRIAQLKRDNGQYIKREGTLFSDVEQNTSEVAARLNNNIYGVPFKSGTIRDDVTTSTRCWFSARFKYYIPGLNHPTLGKARAIQELWDLKITPEQVWELIPFSWLVDWFTNTGDLISNLMSQIEDNLVAKYAYVMLEKTVHTERVASLTHSVVTGDYLSGYPTQCNYSRPSCTQRYNTKIRAAASPFGFNADFDSLTGYQTSILSALGLSRLRF